MFTTLEHFHMSSSGEVNADGVSFKMSEESIDFGELSQDENFKRRILDFRNAFESASELVRTVLQRYKYEELSVEDKIRYDLFLAFAINSYFWMYLRLKGIDTSEHEIKDQINRVRDYMKRSKETYEKKTKMPRLNQGAAKRFIKSGLWTAENSQKSDSNSEASPCKRRCPQQERNDAEK